MRETGAEKEDQKAAEDAPQEQTRREFLRAVGGAGLLTAHLVLLGTLWPGRVKAQYDDCIGGEEAEALDNCCAQDVDDVCTCDSDADGPTGRDVCNCGADGDGVYDHCRCDTDKGLADLCTCGNDSGVADWCPCVEDAGQVDVCTCGAEEGEGFMSDTCECDADKGDADVCSCGDEEGHSDWCESPEDEGQIDVCTCEYDNDEVADVCACSTDNYGCADYCKQETAPKLGEPNPDTDYCDCETGDDPDPDRTDICLCGINDGGEADECNCGAECTSDFCTTCYPQDPTDDMCTCGTEKGSYCTGESGYFAADWCDFQNQGKAAADACECGTGDSGTTGKTIADVCGATSNAADDFCCEKGDNTGDVCVNPQPDYCCPNDNVGDL